jgi:C4-dicarboxylate-specific signal transduction histidine kinase
MKNEDNVILIVDDVSINIQMIREILNEDKVYKFLFATNGNQAVAVTRRVKPDLILLDIIMSGMNGFEVCEVLKSSPETADIPIIFLTAKTESEAIVRGFELGAVDYITKPFQKDELLARVRTHLKLRQSERALRENKKNLEQLVHEELEKRRKQEQLLIQKSKLESLGRVAAGIAHEINQPLAGIAMGVENILLRSMKKRIDKDYLKQECEFLLQDVDRIKHIIEHIRIFSREQQSVFLENVDIKEVVENALLMVGKQYENHNIKLSLELEENIAPVVGNKYKLEQALLNLLSNSKDALEDKSGSEAKLIKIRTCQDTEKICLEVEDNGKGISEEDMEKLFEPFFTTKSPDKGTGLGLSITYGIVKEMRGEISVQSKAGEYSKIKISLPKIAQQTKFLKET